ncbi:hypothetical protein [Streptomyces sp. DSM 118878]
MRRGLVHTVAWSLATGAAVTLSWWGVHTVLAGTVYDPPLALPLADGGDRTEPLSSSTHRAEEDPADKPDKAENPDRDPDRAKDKDKGKGPDRAGNPRRTAAPPEPSKTRPKSPAPPSPAPAGGDSGGTGTVKSYNTDGGRVVLDLGEESATLVSATPAAGWSVRTWTQEKWVRVDFTGGAATVSVFCTWHDSAPRVEITKS